MSPAPKALVERYFGGIPRGPERCASTVTPTPLRAEKRLVLEDPKATLPRLTIAWDAGGVRSPDRAALDALASLLTQDRTSRLTKLLVYDRQLVTSVSANAFAAEDEGTFPHHRQSSSWRAAHDGGASGGQRRGRGRRHSRAGE